MFDCFQTLLKTAGAQMKPTVFLITDTQIKEESFLEDIDSLLNTGEVPNLFAVDEKAELVEVSSYSKVYFIRGGLAYLYRLHDCLMIVTK